MAGAHRDTREKFDQYIHPKGVRLLIIGIFLLVVIMTNILSGYDPR